MTSELSSEDREILLRYLNRKNAPVPAAPKVDPVVIPGTFDFSIDNLVKNEKTFYNNTKVGDNYVGLPLALEEAQKWVKANNGIVATMPYLIAGKANAFITDAKGNKLRDDNNYLWKQWLTALSEEYVGIDEKGKYAGKGKSVLITLHGGGILTPDRIKKAYADGLTAQNAAKLEAPEITNLLNGVLPSGEHITVYSFDDLKKGIQQPFGKYAAVIEFDKVKSLQSKQFKEKEFLANPLVLMRAGTMKYLSEYYEKAHDKDGLGCYHRFNETNPSVPSGRLLFLNGDCSGLGGNDRDLGSSGRFVGVAPEAQRKKK